MLIASLAKNQTGTKRFSFTTFYRRLVWRRRLVEFFLTTLIFFGGQQFVIQNHYFSPLWPAFGVAVSAVLLRGSRLLFGIGLGTSACFWMTGMPWAANLVQTALFLGTVYALQRLSHKIIGSVQPLENIIVLLKFLALSSVLIGIYAYLLLPSWFLGYHAWIGMLNSLLCLTCLCLVFNPFLPARYFKRTASWWKVSVGLIVLHVGFFFLPTGTWAIAYAGILGGSLSLYAFYYGQFPLCVTLMGISVIYLDGALPQYQLFQQRFSPHESSLIISLFTVSAVISLIIGTYQQQKENNILGAF